MLVELVTPPIPQAEGVGHGDHGEIDAATCETFGDLSCEHSEANLIWDLGSRCAHARGRRGDRLFVELESGAGIVGRASGAMWRRGVHGARSIEYDADIPELVNAKTADATRSLRRCLTTRRTRRSAHECW